MRGHRGERRHLKYGSESPHDIPAYSVTEAARYLQIPRRTIHNWLYGSWASPARPSFAPRRPLIDIAAPDDHLLSFLNMLELHVLDVIRHVHGIDMREVRRALDYVQRELKVDHPLANEQMETDGKRLFIRRLNKLIEAGRYGQVSMSELFDIQLSRIERDPKGIAIKLYLFTRRKPEQIEIASQEPRLIALDPSIAFGRPVIAGSRIPTVEIAERYKAGDSIAQLIEEYARPAADIEEAIRCELRLDAA